MGFQSASSYLLAASCINEVPASQYKNLSPRVLVEITERIEFPNRILEKGTLLTVGLPLPDGQFVIFRTSSGTFTLGYRVSHAFFMRWKPRSPWIVLPAEGVEIIGTVDRIITPSQKALWTRRRLNSARKKSSSTTTQKPNPPEASNSL